MLRSELGVVQSLCQIPKRFASILQRNSSDRRSEYAARGIAEYWIVDPIQQKVTVLEWVEGLYEEKAYEREEAIASPLLGALNLTAAQVLQKN